MGGYSEGMSDDSEMQPDWEGCATVLRRRVAAAEQNREEVERRYSRWRVKAFFARGVLAVLMFSVALSMVTSWPPVLAAAGFTGLLGWSVKWSLARQESLYSEGWDHGMEYARQQDAEHAALLAEYGIPAER